MTPPMRTLALALVLSLPVAAAAAAPSQREPAQPIPASGSLQPTSWRPPVVDLAAVDHKASRAETFIVLLEAEPLALYVGGLPGLEPTSPTVTGTAGIEADSPRSLAYLGHLDAVQGQLLTTLERELGRPLQVRARYRHALNALSLRLTPAEAARVAAMPGVLSVTPNTPQPVLTDTGPRWIGAPGVWDGSALGAEIGTMGEGLVVGIVDTGINVDHPSFAEVDENGYEHLNPRDRYYGFCDPDHPRYDPKWKCNQKLIGLYSFLGMEPNAYDPEDDNGHGSHTASTAAGNFVTAPYRASTVTLDLEVSGVAPHANIIAYDACFTDSNNQGVCPPEATLAALEQALRDGVDVINYSIATSRGSPWADPHAQAFRSLRAAGTFAAVSAGNSGPAPNTTAAIAPWITAVAATTSDRYFENRITGMSGGNTAPPADIVGRSLTSAAGPAKIVYAGNGKHKNVSGAFDDGACSQAFPAGTFSGEIVVCDRVGNVARVQRSVNVRAGGAGGFVLANTQAQGATVYSDAYVLPGVHIGYADGAALKAWLASGSGHVAQLVGSSVQYDPDIADQLAAFSSRGPAVSEYCCRRPDLPQPVEGYYPMLKPDVAAPGAEVIAATASGGQIPAPELAAYGGTSMSSPHVAGAAALVMAARPDWTPAEVQSVLMSTAVGSLRKETGAPSDAFDAGAGRVDVAKAVGAGLLWGVTQEEYLAADPDRGGDLTQLNVPSMLDAECLDTCTFRRTVRSGLSRAVTWRASARLGVNASGMGITVSPSTFTLAPGASQEIVVQVDAAGLTRNRWSFATVHLDPDGPGASPAHMPVAVLPVSSLLPDVVPVYTLEPTGHHVVPGVRTGAISDLQVGVHGLAKGRLTELSLAQDPNTRDRLGLNAGKAVVTMTVPANARRIVAEVYASTSKDIDMVMGYDQNNDGKPQANEALCVSFGESYQEYCEVVAVGVPASTFWVVVQNYLASDDAPDTVKLVTAAVPDDDEGNLSVRAPSAVALGQPFDIDLTWTLPDMAPDDRWYGMVQLGSSAANPTDIATFMVDVIGRQPPATPTPQPTATREPTVPAPTPDWSFAAFLPKALRHWPALEAPALPTAAAPRPLQRVGPAR